MLGCDNRLTIYFKQVPQDLYAYLIILFQQLMYQSLHLLAASTFKYCLNPVMMKFKKQKKYRKYIKIKLFSDIEMYQTIFDLSV